jgi:hypothetical protein
MSLDPCVVATRSHLVARALYARGAADGTVEQRGAVHVAFSGSAAGSFNTAFILDPLAEPRAEVKDFVAWAETLAVPYHVYLRDGVDAAAEEALRTAGFSLLDTEPWMLAEPVADDGPDGELPGPLEIRQVADAGGFREHLVTAAEAFEMEAEDVIGAFPEVLLADDRLLWFTGYLEDRPVATMAAIQADQVLDLQNIGVIEDARRAGYGSAITRCGQHLAARLGCVSVSLQASPMGERLHRRLGFRAACHYRVFASPRR